MSDEIFALCTIVLFYNVVKVRTVLRYLTVTSLLQIFAQNMSVKKVITRDLGAAHSEDFAILACTVLIQITSVTDGQTDRQTDALTMAKT